MHSDQHHPAVPVLMVDTPDKLRQLAEKLLQLNEFAFDTEFDRFKREYGFKLYLLQIWTGTECYLVDPLRLPDLRPLWNVFENKDICKVSYACSEDIELLKLVGCEPVNIYDVQVAAWLLDYGQCSLADIVKREFGITLDKTHQTADWKRRPLDGQLKTYAVNDVVHLLELKRRMQAEVRAKHLEGFVDEENRAFGNVKVKEHRPELTASQKLRLPKGKQERLLELFIMRDRFGQQINMPPRNIIPDEVLETMVNEPGDHPHIADMRGIWGRLKDYTEWTRTFDGVIARMAATPFTEEDMQMERSPSRRETSRRVDAVYKPIRAAIAARYGENAVQLILRGFKANLEDEAPFSRNLKPYQVKLITEAAEKAKINLK